MWWSGLASWDAWAECSCWWTWEVADAGARAQSAAYARRRGAGISEMVATMTR